MNIEILSSQVLKEVPSASGIIKSGDNYHLIGDNSPFLFSLNSDFKLVSKTRIYAAENLLGEIFAKKDKPDFEAMELVNENEILVLGSGSKSPERNICLSILLENSPIVKTYDITSFYAQLKKLKILDKKELNIEALAFRNNEIYLFNRGRNVIFSFKYNEMMDYFKGLIPLPNPKSTLFNLPKINGLEAGFSGATASPKHPFIIYTASVENTNNAYDDGEILGSFIGIIDIDKGGVSNSIRCVSIPNIGAQLKIESVTIAEEISDRITDILLVSDSDGGQSQLIKCRLNW